MSTPKDLKIEKTNLTDEVYNRIHDFISSGNWKEGEKIPGEVQLSKLFDVSRAVVREALQRLRSEKCILTRHGIGSFVANPSNYSGNAGLIEFSSEAFEKMTAFRESVEFAAMGLAKTNATQEDIRRLFEAIGQMKSNPQDSDAFSEADYAFHEAVVACSHNEFLLRAYQANRKPILEVFKELNRVPESQGLGIVVHEAIAEGIRDGKEKDVIAKIRRHDAYNRVRMAELGGKSNV